MVVDHLGDSPSLRYLMLSQNACLPNSLDAFIDDDDQSSQVKRWARQVWFTYF